MKLFNILIAIIIHAILHSESFNILSIKKQCKHKMGKGFKRGAYWCPCKSGHKYPWSEQQPYDGKVMEQATREEYEEGFMCTPSQCK